MSPRALRLAILCALAITLTACEPGGDGTNGWVYPPGTVLDAGGQVTADTPGGWDTPSLPGPDGHSTQDTSGPEDTGTPTPAPDTSAPPQDAPVVSSTCLDGQYDEVLPTPWVDLSPWVSAYTPSQYMGFIDGVLGARYPVGQHLVQGGLNSEGGFSGNCVDLFLSNTSSATSVITQLSTLVHECGHFFDSADFFSDTYVITETLTFKCSGGSTPDNGGGQTFSRSLIKGDLYADLWPPCASFGSGGACDSYAAIYLDGDPNDGTFDSGDQGFGSLLEETVQYVNSLATGYAFNDYYSFSASERDGILTFLWYVTRYLRLARLSYPATYALLSGDTCWREAILTVWGRAWLYLTETEGMNALGIDDDFLMTLATEPALLEEIQRLRDLQGCP